MNRILDHQLVSDSLLFTFIKNHIT
uniref:Uncharacterized protein n=1 Tax=Rhizophora mucronata TaxID=61149 RepID=A0A2P2P1P1_RHIMU